MPIYEFRCTMCHTTFEKYCKYDDHFKVECPNCGRFEVEKLLSTPNFLFKGSGFYITDYKQKAGKKEDK